MNLWEDNSLRNFSDHEFIVYLERMADDLEESGHEATARDYREMVRRLDEAEFLKGRVLDYVVEALT